MNHLCRLAMIPRWIRLLLGAILSIFGFLLFLTPIPGGIMLSAFGGMLLLCASPFLRRRMLQLFEGSPWIKRHFEMVFRDCQSCPRKCRPGPSFDDPPCKPWRAPDPPGRT